ncbi:MAG TPA: hypothetical protein VFF81_00430 [Noviherbaspirillum sp.]|nr:hypothetical protein [Noviherbaspirillum sp.]
MKRHTLLLAAMTLAFPLTGLAAESGHHDHGAAPQKIQLNAGKKWPTDEALRKGMSAMRTHVATALPAAHAGKLTPAQYEALGKELNTQVGDIVRNCKLDPKADAQLHVVIGDLAEGIETLEGKRQGKERASGVVRVAQALNAYGKYFDHAGFKAIKLPQH